MRLYRASVAERIWLGRITKAELGELEQVMVNLDVIVQTLSRTNLQSAPPLIAMAQQSAAVIARMLQRQAEFIQRQAAKNSPQSPSEPSNEEGANLESGSAAKAPPGEEEA